jgi:hypothetical protein
VTEERLKSEEFNDVLRTVVTATEKFAEILSVREYGHSEYNYLSAMSIAQEKMFD